MRLAITSSVGPSDEQRLDYAARRAAGAEDQYPFVGDGQAEILAKVGHQAVAVGVVAEQTCSRQSS